MVITQPWLLAEVPLLDDRDFLYREVTQQLPGGIHIIFGQSLTAAEEAACPDVPHPKGVIRGEMGASGERPCTPLDSSPCVLRCSVAHDAHCLLYDLAFFLMTVGSRMQLMLHVLGCGLILSPMQAGWSHQLRQTLRSPG